MKGKTIISILLIVSMVLAFLPLNVFADGRNVIIDFSDGTVSGNEITYQVGESNVKVTVNSGSIVNGKITIDENKLSNLFTFTGFDPDTMNIKLYDDGEFRANYILQQDGTIVRDGEGGLPDDFKLKIEPKGQNNNNENNNNENNNPQFSGISLFAWNCNNKLCVAEINNLIPGGRNGYTMNYIKESDVVDIITGTTLDISKIKNDDYYWLWDSAQLIIQDEDIIKDWSTFRDFIEKNKRDYAIDPCGSINGNNTITTNGDRVFRATIYQDNKYEAISFSNNANDYEYFPAFWDDTFFSSTVDISGTTKENPAVYEAYILEKTIKFESGINSKYEIENVKALVDNTKAVTVKKVNDVFEVTFNSNFYSQVKLELTDSQGNKYYVMVNRTAIQAYDNFGPQETDEAVIAELYYPTTNSYTDFEVYGTINYKDGTSKVELAKNIDVIDKFNGSNLGKEGNGGNGLKRSAFKVSVDSSNITGVSFNVIYKNTNKDTYKGTFAGSGKGITYNIEKRGIVYE